MSVPQEDAEFTNAHPFPDKGGPNKSAIESLFKFYRFDPGHPEYLDYLFIDKKLHTSFPADLNDPFECKPFIKHPCSGVEQAARRKSLTKAVRAQGLSKTNAEHAVANAMADPESLNAEIEENILTMYSELRLCCFTTQIENLLFWSHYADSHKGFCVEYDAKIFPFSYARKVDYSKSFPDAAYPLADATDIFIPALTKSNAWKYEEEFRIVYTPDVMGKFRSDGESLLLNGTEIKNIYLGVNIDPKNKENLLKLINDSDFSPGVWDTGLSNTSYELKFRRRVDG